MNSDSTQSLLLGVLDFVLKVIPFLILIVLVTVLWRKWVQYVRLKNLASKNFILLEVQVPREVTKTPLAMELFLNSFYQIGGEATKSAKYWKGSTRPWFSLEICSFGGEVKFFIWTPEEFKDYISSQAYAQYPGIEVSEIDDYAKTFNYSPEEHNMFGVEMQLTKADPYPIKTYVDYGLDKPGDEEFKTDPIAPMLEFFGSIRPGEQMWLQIIVRAHKKEDPDPDSYFGTIDKWEKDAKSEIKDIQESIKAETDAEGKPSGPPGQLTSGQKMTIEALERSISKISFDTGIRGMYIAEKDVFNGVNIGALIGTFKQYNSISLNGFKPAETTAAPPKWKDWFGKKAQFKKDFMLNAYVNRGFFYYPFEKKKFVLNTEELATIYHFPGNVVQTPTFKRVSSRKSDAPSNLPI